MGMYNQEFCLLPSSESIWGTDGKMWASVSYGHISSL